MNKKVVALRLLLAAPLVLALVVASACYGSSNPTPSGSTPTAVKTGNTVNISGFAFSPANLTVSVGTTVTWANKDSATHTVTSDSGAFDSGSLSTNKTYSFTFASSGAFSYHCAIHTYMKGTITVQ